VLIEDDVHWQGASKQKRRKEVGSIELVPVYVPVRGKPENKRQLGGLGVHGKVILK
jgi:hypothetical protein